MPPAWLEPLATGDPSLPVAFAALVRSADASGVTAFDHLLLAYCDTFVRLYRVDDPATAMELSGDEIRLVIKGEPVVRSRPDEPVAAGRGSVPTSGRAPRPGSSPGGLNPAPAPGT